MEIWKDITGYENLYQASNLGRVRSLDRTTKTEKGSRFYKGKLLKIVVDKKTGYHIYGLSKDGKVKNLRCHVLVAMAFLDHTPCGYKLVVDHKDENPLNNNLNNLKIVTHRTNISKSKAAIHKNKYTGVSWHKTHKKYISSIMVDGKLKHLGYFDNPEDANNKRLAYAKQNI